MTYIKSPKWGEVWWRHGYEAWKVLEIGQCDDEFGNKDREYIVLINPSNNNLRTVWYKTFIKKWRPQHK